MEARWARGKGEGDGKVEVKWGLRQGGGEARRKVRWGEEDAVWYN